MENKPGKFLRSKRFVYAELGFLLLPLLSLVCFIGLIAINQTEITILLPIVILLSASLFASLLVGGLGIYLFDGSSRSYALLFLSAANTLTGGLFLLYLSTEPLRFKMI